MSSRISLTLALALLALTDVPSVLAKSNGHSMLRRELSSVKIPEVDEALRNSVDLDIVQIPKWSEVKLGLYPTSPSNTSNDEN